MPGWGASAASSSPQHAEQAAHLPERVAPGVADRAQRGGGRDRPLLGARRRAVGLHDDHRQRVRDDVMQLARDPGALERGADRGLLVALERQQAGALAQRGELGAAGAPPRAERRRQQHRDHRRGGDLDQRDVVVARLPAARAEQRADDRARSRRRRQARVGPVRRDRVERDQRDDVARHDAVQDRDLGEADDADRHEDEHGRAPAERHAREQGEREREAERDVGLRRQLAGQHEHQQQHSRQPGIARHGVRVVPAREPGNHPAEDRHATSPFDTRSSKGGSSSHQGMMCRTSKHGTVVPP